MANVRQLGKQDVLFIAGESDTVYQHTAGLVILDISTRPDFSFEYFRNKIIERIDLVPHFKWKLHEVPLALDMPYWVEDESFSYDHHIKRIAVPSPGDRQALSEVVTHLYSKHLDRNRPLWEIWVIEGLPDGKLAILQKLHHCMMDGQGASKLGEILCDLEPDAEPREIDAAITGAKAGAVPSQWQVSTTTARNMARIPGAMYQSISEFVRPKILGRLGVKEEVKQDKPELPIAFFNSEISSERGFVFNSVSLADIKVIKDAFDVSVNDVVLALVGSTIRSYLKALDELPKTALRAGIAVSLRTEDDDEFSNKVTTTPVTLATDLKNPVARLKAISDDTERAKQHARGGGTGLMEVMQIMPPVLVNTLMNISQSDQMLQMMGSNLIVSSVRGSPIPLYIAGVRMETMYPMSIIAQGMAINFTCISYGDNVDFGVAIDPEIFPQPWDLADGLQVAAEEYLALAKKKVEKKARKALKKAVKKKEKAAKKKAAKNKVAAKSKAAPKKKAAGTTQTRTGARRAAKK
jgi:WS/DGAT/MGAT family acyltransferase